LIESGHLAAPLATRNKTLFLRGWSGGGFDQLLHWCSHHEQHVCLPLFRSVNYR
jgi:hypothetical protein